MIPRSLAPLRQARLVTRCSGLTTAARRWQSTEAKQPSAHTQFYKTFGRPIAKVFLMAVFTYQLVYYGWAKLEQEEIKGDRTAEIEKLESQVRSLSGVTTPKTK